MKIQGRARFLSLLAATTLFLSVSQVRAYNDSLVTCDTITIGSGPYSFDFAVMADPHVGCWKKKNYLDQEDFGTLGWNDYDDNPNEKPYPESSDSCCVAFVRDSLASARFVVVVGDVAHTSERSEFQRARKVFAPLDSIRPFVPLLGNHDGWPYVGHLNNYDEEGRDTVCIGEHFVDAFRGVYDSLRYVELMPNWKQSDQLLTADSTNEGYPRGSYYANFAFSYQGARFIATDFTTRAHAVHPPGYDFPGLNYDAKTYGDAHWRWTLDWLTEQVGDVQDGERIVCLGHNAYYCLDSLTFYPNFQPDGIKDIRNCGLHDNKPIATSIGGHLEFDRRGYQLWESDTVCRYFVLNDTKDESTPTVYLFRIMDSVRLEVTHSAGLTLGRSVNFRAHYDSLGHSNAAANYWWDFGDGSYHPHGASDSSPSHQYLNPVHDTVFKVSVKVTTKSGRPVWASDTIYVQHAQGGWAERKPLPADPSGRAIKDGGCMTYDAGTDLVYGSKGNKTGDFYSYKAQMDSWSDPSLPNVPQGTEKKLPYKGSVMCSDGAGGIFLTKGYNTLGFWRYYASSSAPYWGALCSVPAGPSRQKVKQGASLVWAPHNGTGTDTGYVYLLKGYRNEFYRYDPRNNTWTTLLNAPIGASNHVKWDAGSWLVADPRPGQHWIYAFKSKYHEFYRYDTDAHTWDTVALCPMPIHGTAGNKRAKDGSCAVWYDSSIYAFKGGNTREFWRYLPDRDTWQEQDSIPREGKLYAKAMVKSGGALVAHPSMGVLAFKGNKTRDLWRYVPVQSSELDVASRGLFGGSGAAAGGPSLSQEDPMVDGVEASNPRWNRQGTMVCYSKPDSMSNIEQIYQCQYGMSTPEEQVVNLSENCEEPVYSPDGQYIAFQVDDDASGFYQLFVTMASDTGMGGGGPCSTGGTSVAPIGSARAVTSAPALAPAVNSTIQAPTQKTVAVTKQTASVSKARPRGPALFGPIWQITADSADHCHPEWSLDGEWLCYERDDTSGYTQVWRVPAFGGTEQQLTFGSSDHYLPEYMNATDIVFTLSPDTGYDKIAKVNDSTHQVTVLTPFSTDHANPSPSWNGNDVAAEAVDSAGNTQIVHTAGPAGEMWLTSGNEDITEPDFGQDSQTIFAARSTGITSQIVWVDAQNGGYTPVTDDQAIRDKPDAYVDTALSTALAVYEREAWSPENLLLGGGKPKHRHGWGVYLSKFRKRHPHEGSQGVSLGVFALDKAKPNPASGRVTIRWQVPVEADVSLCVYNTAGQLVKVLADGKCKPGAYASVWNGTDAKGRRLSNGVYFYALDNGAKRISRKVVLTE